MAIVMQFFISNFAMIQLCFKKRMVLHAVHIQSCHTCSKPHSAMIYHIITMQGAAVNQQ